MAEFIDAQAMAWQHPDSFDVPEPQTLKSLGPGDNIKVCADDERFWVVLDKIDGDTLYGRVNNHVHGKHGLSYGDRVTLEIRHVYQVIRNGNLQV